VRHGDQPNGHGLPAVRVFWAAPNPGGQDENQLGESVDLDAELGTPSIDYDAAIEALRRAPTVEDPDAPPVSDGPFG
jgi:hypothetical protein